MADQILKDRLGKKIGIVKNDMRGTLTVCDALNRKLGTIKTDASQNQVACDSLNRKIGTYDTRSDVTKDARGGKIGKGNLLVGLYFR